MTVHDTFFYTISYKYRQNKPEGGSFQEGVLVPPLCLTLPQGHLFILASLSDVSTFS